MVVNRKQFLAGYLFHFLYLVSTQGWTKACAPLWPLTGRSCRFTNLCDHCSKEHHSKDYTKGDSFMICDHSLFLLASQS